MCHADSAEYSHTNDSSELTDTHMLPSEPASTESALETRLTDIDPVPDQPFRAAFGCYIGTLLTTVVVSAMVASSVAHPAVVIAATIATSHFSIILGLVAIQDWTYGPERLGSDWRRWSFSGLGLGLAALGVVWPTDSTGILVTTVAGGLLTALVGVGLAQMARNRYVAVWCADEEPVVSWEAPKPWAIRVTRAVICLTVFGVAYGALLFVYDGFGLFNIIQFGGVIVVILAPTNRELDVYTSGLLTGNKLSKTIYHWENLDSYQLTDSELRIRRSWLPDLRFDRAEIDDVDVVVGALEDNLSG